MNVKRLMKLADYLRTIPRSAFNMGYWLAEPKTKAEGEKPGECGFAGCAVGWAAHSGLFRGLKLSQNTTKATPLYRPPGRRSYLRTDKAIERLFDLDNMQVKHLFYPMSYSGEPHFMRPTPKAVGQRIRQLIRNEGRIYQ